MSLRLADSICLERRGRYRIVQAGQEKRPLDVLDGREQKSFLEKEKCYISDWED